MESSGVEESLVRKDEVASHADLEERSVLEEKLCWTRLELQKTLAASADADETICQLATVARRATQERDEARNKRNTLLAQLQARNAQMQMMLTGRSGAHSRTTRPDHAFAAATSYHRARAPTASASTPCGWMAREQYAQKAGASYCFASSSSRSDHGGHGSYPASSLSIGGPAQPAAFHDFPSSSQYSFDPDMFLLDAAESPQDSVAATASPDPGKSSGELELVAEQMLLPRKGKAAQAVPVRGGTGPLIQPVTATGYDLADVVNTAGNSHTST